MCTDSLFIFVVGILFHGMNVTFTTLNWVIFIVLSLVYIPDTDSLSGMFYFYFLSVCDLPIHFYWYILMRQSF